MQVNIVIPKVEYSLDVSGFDEMLASEARAVFRQLGVNSFITFQYPSMQSDFYLYIVQYRSDVLADWLKKSLAMTGRGIAVICGKSSAVERRYLLKNTNADYVIMGEIERTLAEMISRLKEIGYTGFQSVHGLAWLKDGHVQENPRREAIENLDTLPFPEYEYLRMGYSYYPVCVMKTSRNCHGCCTFCEGHLFDQLNPGPRYRAKSAKRICEEMEYVIKTYGYRFFVISDDNFMVDGVRGRQRAKEFAELVLKKKMKIRFSIECRADDIDYDIFALLKKAGLYKVYVGLESGSQTMLNRIGKGISVEQNRTALQTLKDLDIYCHPGHILFDPFTTRKELEDTVAFFLSFSDMLVQVGRSSDRKLFFPFESRILRTYWPGQDEKFYESMAAGKLDFEFSDPEVQKIHDCFVTLMEDPHVYPGMGVLHRRLLCLKKALKSVPAATQERK